MKPENKKKLFELEQQLDISHKDRYYNKDDKRNYPAEEPKKIEMYGDLPEYGKYVLVSGIDKGLYDIRRWHVCEMNDLEDGLDYRDKGQFFWLTESGRKIEEVTHWLELPTLL